MTRSGAHQASDATPWRGLAQRGTVIACLGLLLQACEGDSSATDSGAPGNDADSGDNADAMPAIAECSDLPGQQFWATAFPVLDGVDASQPSARNGNFTGVVEEIASPTRTSYGIGREATGAGYALHIETSGLTIEAALSLPWQRPIVEVGDTVRVTYAIEVFSSIPNAWELGTVEIRDDNDQLLAWVFEGSSDNLLQPAELEFEAVEDCELDRGYGPIIRKGLRATAGTDSVDIGFGEAADVGDFVVLHGDDTDDSATDTSGCFDCVTGRHIAIAVVRGSQASLAARE